MVKVQLQGFNLDLQSWEQSDPKPLEIFQNVIILHSLGFADLELRDIIRIVGPHSRAKIA